MCCASEMVFATVVRSPGVSERSATLKTLALVAPFAFTKWIRRSMRAAAVTSAPLITSNVILIVTHAPKDDLTAPSAFLGRKSLQVYVGHLLLLYGLPWTPGLASGRFRALSLPGGLAALAVVFTLTFGGIALLDLVQRRSERVDGLLRLSSATLLAWALLF